MSIEQAFRVTDRNGKVIGTYASNKIAVNAEKRSEAILTLGDKLAVTLPNMPESERESIAEFLVKDRDFLVGALKSVKDLPDTAEPDEEPAPASTPTNVNGDDQAA